MSANKQRVFITGGSSALMQKVIGLLPPDRFDHFLLTRTSKRQSSEGLEWVVGDLMAPASYERILSSCDLIIHAAAVTHSQDERLYFEVNLEGTKTLLSIAKENPRVRFVFISSRTAGDESGAYGHSKLLSEREVAASGLQYVIIRPAEIFGGNKGEGIDKAITNAMKGGVQACPVGVQSPMYPIHVDDAARMIANIILADNLNGKTVFVNGNVPYSFRDLINEVSRVCGKSVFVIPLPKLAMQLLAALSRLFPSRLGIVPDQVARLYSKKDHATGSIQTISLHDHIVSLCQK